MMSSLFASPELESFMPVSWNGNGTSSSTQTTPRQSHIQFSIIEIDGNLYYLSSLGVDECILKYSHTMSTSLLDTLVKYATGLTNEKITTIVFKNADEQPQTQNKKVVGFWHPQLSKFVLNTQVHADANME